MRSPATAFNASAICSMPKRKIASPPKRLMPMVAHANSSSPPVAARAGTAADNSMVAATIAPIAIQPYRTSRRRQPGFMSKPRLARRP